MTTLNTLGVVGTDNHVPVYNPNERWCWWSINDIYLGEAAQGKHVPKVKDYVMDPDSYTTFRVESIDPVTLVPVLREVRPANMSFSFTETDVLFGVGPGTQADTYRAYLDTSVTPHVLSVDSRLKIYGSMSNYAKIFKGGPDGRVVSKIYDSQGLFVSENIPLELVAVDSHVNYSTKGLPSCNVTEALLDNEVLTVVVYSDQGHVVSKRQVLVENTTFIRGLSASTKYVSHISLRSPFLSNAQDRTIEYPINVPLDALNLIGQVHYSDGSMVELPVDGSKFKLFGMDQFVSSIVGQKLDLVLSYTLASGEASYAGVGAQNNMVTEPYSFMTVNPNNSYTTKLFGYPVWQGTELGYRIQWWMLNLDRNVYFDVTDKVMFNENTGPFDPKGYGYLQRKSVSINLRSISGSFRPFIHTQTVSIVLNNEPSINVTPWTISNESIPGHAMYGQDVFAKKVAAGSIRIDCGLSNYNDWLMKLYENTYPLMDPSREIMTIKPSHFVLTYQGVDMTFPISNWNQPLNIASSVDNFKSVHLRFIKRTSEGDLQLSIASMMIL
jgi:hypothetical protein